MPTDEQRALWAAVRANPLDDTPRLVYADWLQEHGDEPRAEFIRLQCEQAAMFSPSALCSDPNERRLTRCEVELIRCHGTEWLRPIFQVLEVGEPDFNWSYSRKGAKFARGFARDIRLTLRAARHLVVSSEVEPLQDLVISDRGFGRESEVAVLLTEIAAWPHAGCVRDISTYDTTDDCVRAIVGGRLDGIDKLDIHSGSVTDAGAVLLAGWQRSTALRVLDLSDNLITDDGAHALAESPYLGHTVRLYLDQNDISRVARRRLRARYGSQLTIEAETE